MSPAACVRYGTGTLDQACPFQCKTMMPSEATPVVSPISTQASRAENAWMDALPITARSRTAGGNGGNRSVRQLLIPDSEAEGLFDLAAVDWKSLEEAFKRGRPRTAAQRLRSLLSARLTALVRLNPSRVDLVERFEKLVADYNDGSMNTERFFQELLKFRDTLSDEEARSLSEGLTEEQLAVFDL